MEQYSTFVGMDVHKNCIEIAIAESGRNSEVRSYGRINGTLDALDKVVRKLVSKSGRLHFVYEAGPCGYEIYRHLTATQRSSMPSLISWSCMYSRTLASSNPTVLT
jgi:hypothetical protein